MDETEDRKNLRSLVKCWMFLKLINWMNTIHMIKKLDVHLYLSKNIELLLTQTLNNVISGECLIVMSMELNYCITDWTALQQRYQKISSVQNQSDDFMQNIFNILDFSSLIFTFHYPNSIYIIRSFITFTIQINF